MKKRLLWCAAILPGAVLLLLAGGYAPGAWDKVTGGPSKRAAARCVGNLKQMSAVVQQYMDGNWGRLPSSEVLARSRYLPKEMLPDPDGIAFCPESKVPYEFSFSAENENSVQNPTISCPKHGFTVDLDAGVQKKAARCADNLKQMTDIIHQYMDAHLSRMPSPADLVRSKYLPVDGLSDRSGIAFCPECKMPYKFAIPPAVNRDSPVFRNGRSPSEIPLIRCPKHGFVVDISGKLNW